jgi:uroporphyrinogen decarboxylase
VNYLRIQVEAGVNMVQLFDTWAACLPLEYYEECALRYQRTVIEMVRPLGIPVALYVNGSASVLEAMAESGADVLSVDWRLPLSQVRQRVDNRAILQGNLAPLLLFGDSRQVEAQTRKMIADAGMQTRYIANLGHGISPGTPVENARAFIQTVKGSRLECSE